MQSTPFALFCAKKNVPLDSVVAQRIHVTELKGMSVFEDYKVFSVGPKVGKKDLGDDLVFATTPGLSQVVPRGTAILVQNGVICDVLSGPIKFSGVTAFHDDDVEDAVGVGGGNDDSSSSSSLLLLKTVTAMATTNTDELVTWAKESHLMIEHTEKKNGKFANVKLYYQPKKEDGEDEGEEEEAYILFGSKGCHLVTTFACIDDTLVELRASNSWLLADILQDIKRIYPQLLCMEQEFKMGLTLVAEFCDAAHFAPESPETLNRLVFFGLFNPSGAPLDAINSDAVFRRCGLLTVSKQIVFTPGTPLSQLEEVLLFQSEQTLLTEGAVLYCWNIHTGECKLLKKKTAWYIFLRGVRGILMKDGGKDVDKYMKQWMVAKCAGKKMSDRYLKLSTKAAAYNTSIAYSFALWMLHHKYPMAVLGHMPTEGLPAHGFSTYWQQYLAEGGADVRIDFGDFCADNFLSDPAVQMFPVRRDPAEHEHKTLYIQGLPGIGKTTGANHLVAAAKGSIGTVVKIEQDDFHGCTKTTRGHLWHTLQRAENNVLEVVSRCNGNPKEYDHYVELCHKEKALVFFLTPHEMTPLTLAVCLAACLQRRAPLGLALGLVMLGRKALSPSELVSIVVERYRTFAPHPQGLPYVPFAAPPAGSTLLSEATAALKGGNDTLLTFVQDHLESLLKLRRPVEQVFNLRALQNIPATMVVRPEAKQVLYVAGLVGSTQRAQLADLMNTHRLTPFMDDPAYTIKNHHVTLHYHKRKPTPLPADLPAPGTHIPCHISALVIHHFHEPAGAVAAAWVLKRTSPTDPLYHITALVPPHKDAMYSNMFISLPHGTKTADGHVQVIPVDMPPFALKCHYML